MSTLSKSVLLWVGGAVLGLVLAKKHRALGALTGALVVGGIGDATIERCQIGLWPCKR